MTVAPRDGAERWSHLVFVATLLLKGALGVVQIFSALAIASGLVSKVPAFARWAFAGELAEDPNDLLATLFVRLADRLPGSDMTFYGIYFTAHGLLHVTVVVCLLMGFLWAYPLGIAVLSGFVVYQAVEWFAGGGVMLIVLSVIDIAVIGLTVHEWRGRRRQLRAAR
jgi:uncharacterized membrane protein